MENIGGQKCEGRHEGWALSAMPCMPLTSPESDLTNALPEDLAPKPGTGLV